MVECHGGGVEEEIVVGQGEGAGGGILMHLEPAGVNGVVAAAKRMVNPFGVRWAPPLSLCQSATTCQPGCIR